MLLANLMTVVSAHAVTAPGAAQAPAVAPLSFDREFTFLFLALGPLKIFGPFSSMTRGLEDDFKRRLAFRGVTISAIALLAAATIGANMLERWNISIGALELTTGMMLFLIALRAILEQYAPHDAAKDAPQSTVASAQSTSTLAFSPLAFPTIITPYGVGLVILLVTLHTGDIVGTTRLVGITVFVLALDLLAMLFSDRILRTSFVAPVLGMLGSIVAILQVALGVQAVVIGLRLLGVVGTAGAG